MLSGEAIQNLVNSLVANYGIRFGILLDIGISLEIEGLYVSRSPTIRIYWNYNVDSVTIDGAVFQCMPMAQRDAVCLFH